MLSRVTSSLPKPSSSSASSGTSDAPAKNGAALARSQHIGAISTRNTANAIPLAAVVTSSSSSHSSLSGASSSSTVIKRGRDEDSSTSSSVGRSSDSEGMKKSRVDNTGLIISGIYQRSASNSSATTAVTCTSTSASSSASSSAASSPTRNRISGTLYKELEREFQEARGGNERSVEKRSTDDSDDEQPNLEKERDAIPRMVKDGAVSSADMTTSITYYGRVIRFKGNQQILWARDMMKQVIKTPSREKRITDAIRTRNATVRTPDDWLNYEGMFESMLGMAAKPKPSTGTFQGVLRIFLNGSTSTTVEFRNKIKKTKRDDGSWKEEESNVLYAHIHDQDVVKFLVKEVSNKYQYRSNQGMSYPGIVEAIRCYRVHRRQQTDASIAQRQLKIFKGSADGVIAPFDRFLAFFNAVLFGSETSRNSLSFITGLLILESISEGKLTYKQAFGTDDPKFYAVYPMASPFTGTGNIVQYRRLMESTEEEKFNRELSSNVGMKDSRETPQRSQIELKEAVLLKYWFQDFEEPLNVSEYKGRIKNGYAVEFARIFNQSVVLLLHKYFPSVPKLMVYSPDELHSLGWFKPSEKVWEDPAYPTSTVTDFDAFKWFITTARPDRLEKDMQDTIWNIRNEIDYEIYGTPPSPDDDEVNASAPEAAASASTEGQNMGSSASTSGASGPEPLPTSLSSTLLNTTVAFASSSATGSTSSSSK